MSNDRQFTELDMKSLIGEPLVAATEANLKLAKATKEFIEKAGFDGTGNERIVNFDTMKKEMGLPPTKE